MRKVDSNKAKILQNKKDRAPRKQTIFLTQYLFSDQKTYPASVMMMSDMCVAAALRQEPENMKKEIEEKTGYHLRPLNLYKQFHACIPYFPSFPVNEYNKRNWDSLKEIYIKEWIDNYDTMIAPEPFKLFNSICMSICLQ